MMQLFKKKTSKEYSPIVPSGLIAKTEKGFYYVKNGKRFKVTSDRARDSWGLPIIETKEVSMINFPVVGVLGFRDGSLVKNIADGKIYLVSDNKLRHITNPDVLDWMGKKPIDVSEKEIALHALGEELDG